MGRPMSAKQGYWWGYFAVLASAVVVSPDALLIRLIAADDWTFLFWRGVLGGVGLAVFLALRYRLAATAHVLAIGASGIAVAILMAGSTPLFVLSIRLTTAANTLVMISATPLFAAILSRFFLGDRLTRGTWYAVVAVFVGIAVIFGGSLGGATLVGDLYGLAAATILSVSMVIVRRARTVDMIPALALGSLLMAVGVAPVAAPFAVSGRDVALLLVLNLILLPLALILLVEGLRRIPAPDVGIIMLLEAVLGPSWVWLALGEMPGVETLLGGGVVLGTLILYSILARRDER